MKVAVHLHDPLSEINKEVQDIFFKEESVFIQLCWDRILNQRTHGYLKELNEDMITMNVYDADTRGLQPFEIIEESDTSKIREYDVFVVHPSALARLDTKQLEYLVNSKSTRVVLDYLFEAEIETYMPLISTIKELIGTPDNWMLLVGGDIVSNDEDLLLKFKEKTSVDLGFFNYFRVNEACIGKEKLRDRKYSIDTIQKNFRTPKKYDFLCLNLKPRFHRIAIVKWFKQRGILNRNLVTARWSYQTEVKRNEEFSEIKNCHGFFDELESGDYSERLRRECAFYNESPESLLKFIKENREELIISCMQDRLGDHNDRSFANDVYRDSYYSLVTETYYDDEFINQLPDMPEEHGHRLKRAFVTEKTYKPLMYGHPFMVVGNINTNTVLREQGFETFDHEFEFKYDTLNDNNRYNTILSNAMMFDYEKFDYHTLGKIVHNFHNFYDNRKLLEHMDKLWKIIQ